VNGNENFTPEQAEQYEKKRNDEIDKLSIIPRLLSNPATTTYQIEVVENSGAELIIDIANTK
jgi:hypothetical protein